MSMKTIASGVAAKFGRQTLAIKTNSPQILFAAGVLSFGATVILACRATVKMSDILEESTNLLKDTEDKTEGEEIKRKAAFSVKLQTAIKIAANYAPAVAFGVVSIGAFTGSHVILKRRNAGLAAAYAVVDKGFKEYRARVVEDQGKEKDLEYRFGVVEREIVEEGPNGPETRIVKGLDQEAIKKNKHSIYSRIFDETNVQWSKVPNQNQFFVSAQRNYANDLLTARGYIFLSEVYEMLGFEPTAASQQVGWVKNSETGDGYVDFGIFTGSVHAGKEWVNGHEDAILMDFNVDGPILSKLPKY